MWNRTGAVAARHAEEHGTTAVADLEALKGCALIALCVPTSSVSSIICERLVPVMTSTHAVILDHTSGNPLETQALADRVRELSGGNVVYVDAPVSGGPAGAKAGMLTTMCGCSEAFANKHDVLTTALRAWPSVLFSRSCRRR